MAQRYLDYFKHQIYTNIMTIDIPTDKPVIFVARHPFGVLDVAAQYLILKKIRPDLKAIANQMAMSIADIKEDILPVDFNDNSEAIKNNKRTFMSALQHLRKGGSIMMNPSGLISTRPKRNVFKGVAKEGAWSKSLGFLARASQATIIPIYIEGQNSWLFHAASYLSPTGHKTIRHALIAYETINKKGYPVMMRFGHPLLPSSYINDEGTGNPRDDQAIAEYLRKQTLAVGEMELHPL